MHKFERRLCLTAPKPLGTVTAHMPGLYGLDHALPSRNTRCAITEQLRAFLNERPERIIASGQIIDKALCTKHRARAKMRTAFFSEQEPVVRDRAAYV